MKLYLIMNVRFPTEKAHGWQIAKMCEAFLDLGYDITLVVPDRKNLIKESAKLYYGLKTDLPIIKLPVVDFLSSRFGRSRLGFFLMEWTFIRSVFHWAKHVPDEQAVVFTRDQFLAERFSKKAWKLALEIHDVSEGFFEKHQSLVRSVDLFVMTNAWKKQEAMRIWGTAVADKTIVSPNAIDIAPYEQPIAKQKARQELGWDDALQYTVYTGHFYDWKGAYVLADASQKLNEEQRIVLIGGTDADFAKMQTYVKTHGLEKVLLIPHVPQAEVRQYLAAADCLALPNSGKSWHSRFTTSPIKLWEYLASKRPVIASDLPAIRELVTEREVYFVPPDDADELAKAIHTAVKGDSVRVQAGFDLAVSNSWAQRAQKLSEVFKKL